LKNNLVYFRLINFINDRKMDNNQTLSPLQRFFKLLELDKKEITYIYLYAIFAGLITLSLPLGIQAIIGLIAGGAMSASLILLIAVVTVATALSGILKIMQLTVTETIQQRIFTRSSFDFSFRIPRLRIDKLANYYPPELVNRFFDTLTLQKGVPKILMDFSTALLQIVFGLILISFYHSFFVFFGIVLIVILIAIFRLTGPGGLKTSLKESKYKYEVAYWLEELARTMSTFKLSGGNPLSLQRTDELTCDYLDSRKAHFRILLFQYGNIVAFKTVVTAGLLFLGSYLVIDNQINIGQFVAAEIVVILIMASVEKLILSMETIYDVLTALEKLGTVTDLPLEREEGLPADKIDQGKGLRILLENLTYQFPEAEVPALKDIKLEIASGERLCITGYSGSGKTTLLQLMSGLYTNFLGTINFNGFPLRTLELNSLRHLIGDFSSQEHIFRGTIYDNIALGAINATLQQVLEASEKVGLSNFVERLPGGYQTELLPEGRNIPQHVRTKIILARSIVAKPRLLTMEGFFHHLQQEDREQAAKMLTAPDRPWTLVAVTNDPMLASRCDRVIVLQDGEIVKQGTFEEIQRSKHYRYVFKTPAMQVV